MARDRSDRGSKLPTSGKVEFLLFRSWLLPSWVLTSVISQLYGSVHGSELLQIQHHRPSSPGFWVELGIDAQIWKSRDLEGDMGTNLIWMGDSRNVRCLYLCGTLGLAKGAHRLWTINVDNKDSIKRMAALKQWSEQLAPKFCRTFV